MDRLAPLSADQLRSLLLIQSDLMTALNGSTSFPESLRHCFDAALHAGGMDCGGVYLLEPDGGVRLVFHQGVSESYVAAVAHYGPDTHQATMVEEVNKLTEGSDGTLDVAAAEQTVANLMKGGEAPVITKRPEGAWTSAVTDKMKGM